ncbi:hypothetical protein ACFFRR_010500 [Megaselia abdita]
MSRRKKLQLPVSSSSSSSSSSVSCPVISSYFKSSVTPEKSLKLSKFIATDVKPLELEKSPFPKKSIQNYLNLDEDIEKTPVKKVKKAPAPKTKKPKKEKVSKKQPKIKSALLKQEEALSEAITYQSLTEDIDPDELRLALAISRSEAESKGLPVDDLGSLKKFTFTKQAKTTKSWLKGKGKWANKISALTFRDPAVESKKLQERVDSILENIDINLNLPRTTDDSGEVIFIFSSPELCGLLDHRKRLNKGETLEKIEVLEDYYIAGLFEPSTAKAGHLLKSYKFIPGRENSPKKNMESVIYEILDDDEILCRIEGASTTLKESEEKENTFQEYDEEEEEEIKIETKQKHEKDVQKEFLNTPNLKKKHEPSKFQSPCGSPSEKRKKVEEIIMSPDLFCDSDEDDGNFLDRGVVELLSDDEEPVVDTLKLPSVKNPMQLFASEEPSSEPVDTDLKTATTLEVKTNEDIFDLTQCLDDSGSDDEENVKHLKKLNVKDAPRISDSRELEIPEQSISNNEPETFDLTQCLDSDPEENFEIRIPSPEFDTESELLIPSPKLDTESELRIPSPELITESVELRIPSPNLHSKSPQLRTQSPELFDLTEDIFQDQESSNDCIILSDDEEECAKLKNESLKEILDEPEVGFPKKRLTHSVPMEEPEETPPKKRRSRSFELNLNSSPEPTRLSKSFHEDIDSPVNVCNLTFEELRAKYGLGDTSTSSKKPPVRKSFSQPAPTSPPDLNEDDFFDQLILNKFKKRPVRESSDSTQSPSKLRPSMTQPTLSTVPSTSEKVSSSFGISDTQPKPSTSKASSEVKKKYISKKKINEEEVIINQKVYVIKTENIPEKPDYAKMDKETLSVYLKKYGIKELTRKQSVAILDHIYNQMHPLMVEESDE